VTRIRPLGDSALLITLGDHISPRVHSAVRKAARRIAAARIPGVTDIVPAFASVAVHYDPACAALDGRDTPYEWTRDRVASALAGTDDAADVAGRLVDIPVCYGGAHGPDLEELAAAHSMTADEVIRLHAEPEYMVYMLGFLPGFPYLGGLAPELATPRRAVPRTHVPSGSVGIGGEQTGIYPLESPGGWHLIGRTPLRLFTPEQDPPTFVAIGDRIRFRRITEAEFHALASHDTR
jgi:inhibitor of KinA